MPKAPFITTAIFVAAVISGKPAALAQQLESTNFAISNEKLVVGSFGSESASFGLFVENSPLVGSLESDNLSQEGVVLGENIPKPAPTTGSPGGGSFSSSSSSSTTTVATRTSGAPGFLRQFFPEVELISQLFDISLEIDEDTISDIKDLAARVIFTSFGTEPTPVDIIFTLLNSNGEEVYRSKDMAVVETELVFTKHFDDINTTFKAGKYTLVLKTLYNVNVEDEFKAEFTIVEKVGFNWKPYLFASLSGLAVFGFIIFLRKKKLRRPK